MILFIISFLMVFVSSYLLASIFSDKKYLNPIIYMFLIGFAQIILNIEILSLFEAISKNGILIFNFITLLFSIFYWIKKGKPLYIPKTKLFLIQVYNAMKKDKMLFILGAGFLFFIFISITLCAIAPVGECDALAYHINRALQWVSQGSLDHFDISDDRNLYMAINSEILYTWFFSFVYKNTFVGFFSFAGYVLTIISLYSLLEQLGFCMRKKLWAIFLTTSIAGIILEASSVQTNIIISRLSLACLSLFYMGVKKGSLIPIYFSSLAISIAIGTKTSAFFVIPSLTIIFTYFLLKHQKENFWKYAGIFLGFSLLNTLLFSSYNYILNFIYDGNILGNQNAIIHHKMKGGLKGYISGLIRHLFLLIDFTGFIYAYLVQDFVFKIQDKILTFLNIPLDLNVIFSNENKINWQLSDVLVGGGVLSVLILVPLCVFSAIKGFFNKKNEKTVVLALLGLSLFICIAFMSANIGFMLFSSRFINTFLALSAPVFVISYIKSNKNIFKYIILFYVMSYFTVVSTHIWGRHFFELTTQLIEGKNLQTIKYEKPCNANTKCRNIELLCEVRTFLYEKAKPNSKIAIFPNISDNVSLLKFMENDGYKIDFMLTEKVYQYNLKQYDYIIFSNEETHTPFAVDEKNILNNYYVNGNKIIYKNQDYPMCYISYDINEKTYLKMANDKKSNNKIFVSCDIPFSILEKQGFHLYAKLINKKNKMESFSIFKNKNS